MGIYSFRLSVIEHELLKIFFLKVNSKVSKLGKFVVMPLDSMVLSGTDVKFYGDLFRCYGAPL